LSEKETAVITAKLLPQMKMKPFF